MTYEPPNGGWTTRADPKQTRPYGCDEVHIVLFQPEDDQGGACAAVVCMIRESSRRMIKQAIAQANQHRARLTFLCDTVCEAAEVAEYAAKRLPKHRRIALERAEAGAWATTT